MRDHEGLQRIQSTGRASTAARKRLLAAAKRGFLRLGYDIRRVDAPEWADFTDGATGSVRGGPTVHPDLARTHRDSRGRRGIHRSAGHPGRLRGVRRLAGRQLHGHSQDPAAARGPGPSHLALRHLRSHAPARRGRARRQPGLRREASRARSSDVPHGAYLPTVRENMEATGYPPELVSYVGGLVEETIPARAPKRSRSCGSIPTGTARSPTSSSTSIRGSPTRGADNRRLRSLPRARTAVDDYFEQSPIMLTRVDYTGRMGVKA